MTYQHAKKNLKIKKKFNRCWQMHSIVNHYQIQIMMHMYSMTMMKMKMRNKYLHKSTFIYLFLQLFSFVFDSSSIEGVPQSNEHVLLQQENQTLRHRLSEYATNEEIYRKKVLEHEQETNELNEKYEQKYFSLRLEYETKIEQLTTKTSEQQIEIFTLKQMYDTMSDEKSHTDEQINTMRFIEQNLQEKLDKLQMEYEQVLKLNRKPLMIHVLTQTVK